MACRMCRIVVIVKLNRRDTVEEARLKRMRDVLCHRTIPILTHWFESSVPGVSSGMPMAAGG